MTDNAQVFDRSTLARRRARAAGTMHEAAFLFDEVAEGLADRLSTTTREFPLAVDLGAGLGTAGRAVRRTGKIGRLVSTESTPTLAGQLLAPRLVCDEELLPFAPESLDLAVSGLALSFANDVPGALAQIRRALRPDGLFLAALFGGGTLAELREVLLDAEIGASGGASPRIAPFLDIREGGALLQRAGFALPVVDAETLTVRYRNPFGLLRDLRAMGWTNMLAARARTPLRRGVLMRAMELYAERHGDPDGRLRASFEIVYLSGWAPHESQQTPLRPGSAKVRLADALGVAEQPAGEKPPTRR